MIIPIKGKSNKFRGISICYKKFWFDSL